MREEALQGNENIEQAIAALQQNATPELLAHALTAIRRRIRENGQFVVAVEPNPGTTQMSLKVVQTPDGRAWWYAFTSFEEEMRGAEQVQSTFMADIGKLLETALTVPEIEGIILNPWHRTLMLDKTLIQIILPESRADEDSGKRLPAGRKLQIQRRQQLQRKSSGLCAGA